MEQENGNNANAVNSVDNGNTGNTGAGGNTAMIKNPLPGPTPHTSREGVDYDYEVPEDKMHYDIEKPNRNYYDI